MGQYWKWGAVLLLLPVAACAGHPPAATPPVVAALPDEVETTLFLVGDAGAPAENDPVLQELARQATAMKDKAEIVFLGDNVYPRGIPAADALDRDEAERRLLRQVRVATTTGTPAIFIPGNHDWAYMGADGWNAILREDSIITVAGDTLAQLLPSSGCPGPVAVDIRLRLRLVLLDTQWWLHKWQKPSPEFPNPCSADEPQEVLDSLAADLAGAGDRAVVVVGHHPLESGGTHGGYFPLTDQIFPLRRFRKWLWIPLPILGSAMPMARQRGVSEQDISGPANREMRHALEQVFDKYKPLVYASGHDHDLQVLAGSNARHLLVSGTGYYGHVSAVQYGSDTKYAAAESGFMRLDIFHDGRVRLGVVTVNAEGRGTEAFSSYLE